MIEDKLKAGFVIVDKPAGPSSHEVTSWVKRLLAVEKTGHAGTLDPNVTGVLPIAIGKGVKLLELLAESDKEYVCIMKCAKEPKKEELIDVMRNFTGNIYQTPPLESAVKKEMRIRTIHNLKLMEIEGKRVLFKVKCQHGTYIRTLCEDMGEVLGYKCEMDELRRTQAGKFSERDCVTLQDLTDNYVFWKESKPNKLDDILLSVESIVGSLKKIVVRESAISAICHGAELAIQGALRDPGSGRANIDDNISKDEVVALMSPKAELIAIALAKFTSSEMRAMKSGIIAKTDKVLMDVNKYPKNWKKK